MKALHYYRRISVLVFCVLCLCTGCSEQKEGGGSSSQEELGGHNFSESLIETEYDRNYDAIGGDGFLFSVDEEAQEATLVSYYDVQLLEVTLPDAIRYQNVEYPVTSIGESAFESDQSIVKMRLGKNICSVQSSAFYAAAALEEVVFQDTLVSIGEQAFANCPALKKITWGKSLETVGDAAFEGDTEIGTLELPRSVVHWGSEVFMDCTGLTECVVEDGAAVIGEGIFTNCTSLKSVTIPDTVTSIGAEAFWGCSDLRELFLPDSVTMIGDKAFYSTDIQTLRLPLNLSAVRLELLDGMDSLSKITVPASRKKEYENIFQNYGIQIAAY